ncbi:polysaccharide biosynthesis protein [Haloarcula taiwanensis]|uniref:Polysaccharide biosynthesis protein n=1 Tax=Haloarcula taiwanensis TaxID=1932004 RepID=A0A2H4ZX70_9EURY|nr:MULTISPECIES: oligosaccharide flippase family protein [Haloarcula]AUG47078.1 polysaccharide biosynthesis protein [Haloarcula taiwanensis]RLM33324.1 flippase [Haloarcula sp. Atlit-120R]RLM42276.1 flippase [Haloarcula sp. Atlit-47R]RLM95636.1 flippase [Haloarcula sp. Atlit-7R]
MRIGQTSFISFVSKGLSSAAGFIATILFARLLGAEVLGRYYLLLSIVAWLSLLGSIGIGSAITKRVSEGTDIGEYKLAGGLTIAAIGGVIIVGLLLFQDVVTSSFDVDHIGFVIILLAVGLLGSYVDAMLNGAHMVHVAAVLKVARRIARTVLQVGGVLLSFGLTALVMGYALGGLVLVVAGLYVLGGPYNLPEKKHFERLVDYAKYAWMGRLEGKTFQQADVIILGLFVPSSLVGVYGITWNIANFLIIFSTSISGALFPELSKLSVDDRDQQVASLVEDALSYTGLVTIPGLVGGLLLSNRILRIYGDEFVQGAQVLGLLILSVLFYGYQKQFTNALGGIDQPKAAFKVNGILIASNVTLNAALVYTIGMTGAALASALSSLLSLIGGYLILGRHLDFSVPVTEILRQIGATVAMGILVTVLNGVLTRANEPFPNEVATTALIILGAATYFAVLVSISSQFRTVVLDNIPQVASLR